MQFVDRGAFRVKQARVPIDEAEIGVAKAVHAFGVDRRLIADVIKTADDHTIGPVGHGTFGAIRLGFVAPPSDWLAVRRLDREAGDVLHRAAGRVCARHPLRIPEVKFAGLHRYLFPRVKELARDFAGIHFQAHRRGALRGNGGFGPSDQANGQSEGAGDRTGGWVLAFHGFFFWVACTFWRLFASAERRYGFAPARCTVFFSLDAVTQMLSGAGARNAGSGKGGASVRGACQKR